MPSSSSRSNRPRASEVASEAKRYYIPHIRNRCSDIWPTVSYLYDSPISQLQITRKAIISPDMPQFGESDPAFVSSDRLAYQDTSSDVRRGDPVDFAVVWPRFLRDTYGVSSEIPFICAANDKRAGGDWETATAGYEERLCRRSNLSATLTTPAPSSDYSEHYPIPSEGAVLSPYVGESSPNPQCLRRPEQQLRVGWRLHHSCLSTPS